MNKIPIYLVTGFLGSGKTTLLKNIIETGFENKKIAIIQNEFAPANFDAKELKRITNKNFDLLEINNGSVFCVCLLSGFIKSLNEFVQKYSPGIILIEASGLADPLSIGEVFNSNELRDKIFLAGSICIVDAVNFLKLSKVQQRLNHQIMIADTIIINKTDLNNNLEEIKIKIQKLNPLVKIFETQYCEVQLNELFQFSDEKGIKNFSNEIRPGRPDINSAVFRTAKPLKHINLKDFTNELASQSIRIKGYAILDNGKVYSIQSVYNNVQIEEISAFIKQTELIVMGEQINVRLVKEIYQKYN